ncbi:MAG: tetratricopeptide repeat protein [Magnetococcales bacterium]|nr:tetratricopeptide repeat protein [Magnetococcales bacterium]
MMDGINSREDPLFLQRQSRRQSGLGLAFLLSLLLSGQPDGVWSGERTADEARLRRAVEEADKRFGADSSVTAAALTQLGEVALASGRDREAESAFSRAAEILNKRLGADHPELAEAQTRLARARLRLGDFTSARKLLEGVVAALERSLGREHLNTASARINLARLLMAEPSQRETASRLMEEALPILIKGLWADHPRVAEAWMVLSRIRFALGRDTKAQDAVLQALRIREKTLGGEHPLVAECLREQGHQLAARGAFKNAEPLLRRAVEILEKSGESARLELAESLERLGEGLIAIERRSEAETAMQRVLQLREQALGDREHPGLVKILNDLSLLRLWAGDLAGAELLSRRALDVTRKRMGKEPLQEAFILGNLAQIAARRGQKAESDRLFEQSETTAERYFKNNPLGLSDWLANLGMILHKEGSTERAGRLLRRAEALLVASHGVDHPQVARVSRAIQALQAAPGTTPTPRPETVAAPGTATSPPARTESPVIAKKETPPVARTGTPPVALQPAPVVAPPPQQTYVLTPATILPLDAYALPVIPASGQEVPATPPTVIRPVTGGEPPVTQEKKIPVPEGIRQGAVVHLSCYAKDSPDLPRLMEKMRALALPAYRKMIKNGEIHFECVFAGPFASRPEAEAAAEKIRVAGGVENPLVGRYQRGE